MQSLLGLAKKHPIYTLLYVLATAVYIIGLNVDVMGLDSSQYASIAMEMSQTGDYLEVHHNGGDYLDKPPLLFWLAALSYKIFGVYGWAFKLPSFLVSILAVVSTYGLAKRLVDVETGRKAALMLYCSQALFMINNDVRTDTLLLGFSIFSVWQLIRFLDTNSIWSLLAASVGIAGAMLSKGPIGLMLPALALGTDIMLRREWRTFFKWEWLVLMVVTGLLIAPMVYGLYQQWDLHPEKELYGAKNISGVKFYFWDQSFGRLTGDNPFINLTQPKQKNDPSFFIHTSIWAFMPWFFLSMVGLFRLLKDTYQKKFKRNDRLGLLLGATILPFLALSLSEYKLPHYIFITYPFLAILAAIYLNELKAEHWFYKFNFRVIPIIAILMALFLLFFPFPTDLLGSVLAFIGLATALIICISSSNKSIQALLIASGAMILFNLVMNLHFYPRLVHYQAGKHAAHILKDHEVQARDIIEYRAGDHILEIHYGSTDMLFKSDPNRLLEEDQESLWVYTKDEYLEELTSRYKVRKSYSFDTYNVTVLTLPFINPKTRHKTLGKSYLLLIER